MRGTTPLEKARVAELLALLDECCTTFAYWCVFGASTFPQTTNVAAAQVAKRFLFMRLATIGSYMSDRDLSFLDSQIIETGIGNIQYVTIADCVLMSLLQYGIEWYGRDMTEGLPKLKEFYDRFQKRDSAVVEGGYPEELQKRSSTWQEGILNELI